MANWLFPMYPVARDLALLDALSDDSLFPWRLTEAAANRRPREWRQTVNLRGFAPAEVSVKAEGDKIRVRARHEEGEDVTEVQRTLQVPQNVQTDKVSTNMTRDGVLVVRAPFKEAEESKALRSAWDEARDLLRGPDIADAGAHIVDGPDGAKLFKAEVSVREYRPEEVKVRQQGDLVMVEAEHKEERDGQRVQRRLERAFRLPEGTKVEHLVSRLSHDGRLCVEAPYQPPETQQPQLKDVPMEVEKQQQQQVEQQQQQQQQ